VTDDTSRGEKNTAKRNGLKGSGKSRKEQTLSSVESHYRADDIEYYYDSWDTGNYYVCIARMYIFAANGRAESPQWELLSDEDGRWDSAHQRIYRNSRADKILRDDLPAHFPPPPNSIPPEALIPVVNRPPETFPSDDYAALTRHIESLKEKTLRVYLVLFEDKYESLVGDGEFHYPQDAFVDRVSAKRFMRKGSQAYKYHLRELSIRLRDGVLDCPDLELMMFDHFSGKDVLSMANRNLI